MNPNFEIDAAQRRLGLFRSILQRRHHELLLIATAALYMTIAGNGVMFEKLAEVYSPIAYAGFTISLLVLQWALTALMIVLLTTLLPTRPVVALLLIVTAATTYFDRTYGTVIDSTMIQNVMETDIAEATELFNANLALQILLIALLPAAAAWFLPIRRPPLVQRLVYNTGAVVVLLVTAATAIGSYSAEYASFIREHKLIRFHSNPLYPVYSMALYASEQLVDPEPTAFAGSYPDARMPQDPNHELVIMVVGETARWDHLGLNGYDRDTTPHLAAEPGVVSYDHVTSCGTTTAVSVPCMFSFAGENNFDGNSIREAENALDVLQRVGVTVLWRDNSSGSKGVADRVAYEDFSKPERNPICDPECRDVGMLSGLQDYIDQNEGDVLVVLHQQGSHGPEYGKRYPAEFEVFTPACHNVELAECSTEEVRNAYDNTIAYTDYFLSEVIAFLKTNDSRYQTAMLYVSDHGESLGEQGIFLHGLPKAFAPEAQTHVPLLVWHGKHSDIEWNSVMERHTWQLSHDAVSRSLLLEFKVNAPTLNDDDALFKFRYPALTPNP